jgi:Antirepressor regulating drug resistance, predicted signal transduction N-terminal membrane component
MIAAWMLYATLVSALVAAAALAAEHVARFLRRPLRLAWLFGLTGALLLSSARLPGVAASARSSSSALARKPSPAASADLLRAHTGEVLDPSASAPPAWTSIEVPRWLSAFDRPLVAFWLGASLLWAGALAVSAMRMSRRRHGWKPTMMDGTPILLSHDVGPALVGITRHQIVVPEWVLELGAAERRLIILHELEHARVADPVLLLAGALLLMLQPWNVPLWFIFRRLRLAVELDCDARVLAKEADTRTYGELLLRVGERAVAGLLPVATLVQPHSSLERRIALMTESRNSHPILHVGTALGVGGLLAFVACQTPRPVQGSSTLSPMPPSADIAHPANAHSMRDNPLGHAEQAVVHLTSVGLEDVVGEATILVYAVGHARVGLGAAEPTELTDTLRLHSLPTMALDVTDGDVHLKLEGSGKLRVGGPVTGGGATHLSANGHHIVVLKGGIGVRSGDVP